MVPANVKLSKNELALVCDETIILTKINIINKVYELFGALSESFANELIQYKSVIEPKIFQHAPKIYKGEQYKSLPYVMMDHPRFFNKTDAFAIRCFFWWGNFFSITLHLEGSYSKLYTPSVIQKLSKKENTDWHYCVNESKWEHDFEETNYKNFSHFNFNNINVTEKDFFKIAKKIPLQKWDDAYDFYKNNFIEILEMIR